MMQLRYDRWRSEHVYADALSVYQEVAGGNVTTTETFDCFLGDVVRAATPSKRTVLHVFIEGIVEFHLDYSTRKVPEFDVRYYRDLLLEAEMPIPQWLTPELVSSHVRDLDPMLAKASKVLIPSIFYLLFSDRTFLGMFQRRVATWLKTFKAADHPSLFIRDGVLRRPTHLPQWLKAAIFYRDRGRCQHCNQDMTGKLRPIKDLHLDHIVPLAASGSNDPTNFQLSCARCNILKGKRLSQPPHYFEPYW